MSNQAGCCCWLLRCGRSHEISKMIRLARNTGKSKEKSSLKLTLIIHKMQQGSTGRMIARTKTTTTQQLMMRGWSCCTPADSCLSMISHEWLRTRQINIQCCRNGRIFATLAEVSLLVAPSLHMRVCVCLCYFF